MPRQADGQAPHTLAQVVVPALWFLRDDPDFLDAETWTSLAGMGVAEAALYEYRGVWVTAIVFTWPHGLWELDARPSRVSALGALRTFLEGLLIVRATVREDFPAIAVRRRSPSPIVDVWVRGTHKASAG